MLSKVFSALKTFFHRLSEPLHIEFNLTDFCNLNCKGCTHYSPLAPKAFQDLSNLENQMRHISGIKHAEKIKSVFLIGGETLLYPQINPAIKLARQYFPWAKISVFTNGLLLPKMNEDFWNVCRENDCRIALTRYPLKINYDKIEDICREKGIEVDVFGDRGVKGTFFKMPLDPQKKQNGTLSHFRCFSFGCITIDDGKIFPCSQSACVKHLNNKFGTDFNWEQGDFIRVEDLNHANQLIKLRNNPVPFCKYCKHIEVVDYGPSRKVKEEWV